MAIINSYPYDIIIHDKDAWIGTDSLNRQTKQYTAEAVANYLNTKGKVSIGGQMMYKYHLTGLVHLLSQLAEVTVPRFQLLPLLKYQTEK